MSTRPRVPALVGVVCTAVLLAGCSSSGTIGSGSSRGSSGGSGSSGGFTGSLTGGSSGGSSGTSGGSSGSDPGCTEAMLAIQNAEKAQNSSDPQAALKGVKTSISQLHDAAQATRKPGGKDAINKVADDLQNILNLAMGGQQSPDTSQALADAQQVATICGV